MAAAQNQFGGRQVTRIVLCGRGDADAALARQIEKETSIRTAAARSVCRPGTRARRSASRPRTSRAALPPCWACC